MIDCQNVLGVRIKSPFVFLPIAHSHTVYTVQCTHLKLDVLVIRDNQHADSMYNLSSMQIVANARTRYMICACVVHHFRFIVVVFVFLYGSVICMVILLYSLCVCYYCSAYTQTYILRWWHIDTYIQCDDNKYRTTVFYYYAACVLCRQWIEYIYI